MLVPCVNKDNGHTNVNGDGCKWYKTNKQACDPNFKLDDSDFTAMQMCCACGGGGISRFVFITILKI